MVKLAELQLEHKWLPMRVTLMRDGHVLETHVIADPSVISVPSYGPGVVCVLEFNDGTVEVAKGPPRRPLEPEPTGEGSEPGGSPDERKP